MPQIETSKELGCCTIPGDTFRCNLSVRLEILSRNMFTLLSLLLNIKSLHKMWWLKEMWWLLEIGWLMEMWWLIGDVVARGDVVAHIRRCGGSWRCGSSWRCGGSLVVPQTSGAEVPGSNPVSPTMILMRCSLQDHCDK